MQKVVTFGEIMLRLAAPGYKRFIQSDNLNATFGGGEANVAVSLANYGIPVDFVTRLPKNEIAEWCISDLGSTMQVPNKYCEAERELESTPKQVLSVHRGVRQSALFIL